MSRDPLQNHVALVNQNSQVLFGLAKKILESGKAETYMAACIVADDKFRSFADSLMDTGFW